MSECGKNALAPKLEHCPFCPSGGDPRIVTAMGEAWVLCYECGASSEMKATVENAVKHWNMRFERTCRINTGRLDGMTCDACGAKWTNYMKCFSNDPFLGNGAARECPNYCPNCGAKAVRR